MSAEPKYVNTTQTMFKVHSLFPPLQPLHGARNTNSTFRILDGMVATLSIHSILHQEASQHFSMPKLNMYDRFSGSFDHLMHFHLVMTLESHNDALLCKVFPSSLQSPTLSWFHHLLANSVSLFRMLFKIFTTHYLCSVRRKKSVASLFHIKLDREESILSFMKRFGVAILQLNEVSMDTVIQAIKEAIFPNTHFLNSISLDPPL